MPFAMSPEEQAPVRAPGSRPSVGRDERGERAAGEIEADGGDRQDEPNRDGDLAYVDPARHEHASRLADMGERVGLREHLQHALGDWGFEYEFSEEQKADPVLIEGIAQMIEAVSS